jgi:hypothetical protein
VGRRQHARGRTGIVRETCPVELLRDAAMCKQDRLAGQLGRKQVCVVEIDKAGEQEQTEDHQAPNSPHAIFLSFTNLVHSRR